MRPHARSTLFPYTTLFRSRQVRTPDMRIKGGHGQRDGRRIEPFPYARGDQCPTAVVTLIASGVRKWLDRKSTRLNSSHVAISYAVFCLKKKRTDRCGNIE